MGALLSHPIKAFIIANAAILYSSPANRFRMLGSSRPTAVVLRTIGEVLKTWLEKDIGAAGHFIFVLYLLRKCAFAKNFTPFGGAPGQMPKSLLGGEIARPARVSPNGLLSFPFKVKGQEGTIPQIGFGTATLFDDTCTKAVRHAIRAGYRHIDTALLYNNQEAVGEGIRQAIAAGEVKREDLFVTTKVAFFPEKADGKNTWVPIEYHEQNRKQSSADDGTVMAGVDLCLEKLGLEYVDLLLVHCPCTELDDFKASSSCHLFELSGGELLEEREMVLEHRNNQVQYDEQKAEVVRAATWATIEEAQRRGKCKFIGVSNYPTRLMRAMEGYARVMPAVNQLELHPRFANPSLQQHAKETGCVLTGYGSGNSMRIEKSDVVNAIAERMGVSPIVVVLRWTLQRGVVVVPRTATEAHIEENLSAGDEGCRLGEEDMGVLDAMNEAHPYYWSPLPLLPPNERNPDM